MCTLTVWALQLVNAKDEKEGESLGKFWSKAESKIPSSLLFSWADWGSGAWVRLLLTKARAEVLEPVRTFRIQTQPREGWFRLKQCLWKCVFTLFENCSRKWESRTKEATIKLRDLRALFFFFNIQLCFKHSFLCSKFHLWFHAKTSYLALGAEQ